MKAAAASGHRAAVWLMLLLLVCMATSSSGLTSSSRAELKRQTAKRWRHVAEISRLRARSAARHFLEDRGAVSGWEGSSYRTRPVAHACSGSPGMHAKQQLQPVNITCGRRQHSGRCRSVCPTPRTRPGVTSEVPRGHAMATNCVRRCCI